MKTTALICALAFAAASPAAAASWDSAFAGALPAEALAKAAVDVHPDVEKAKVELDLAKAQGRVLAAGEHEFVASALASERTVQKDRTYPEFNLDISRAVRLPGKAALDRRAGALGVKAAEDMVDDARHQTGLTLADAWYGWVEATVAAALDQDTEKSLSQEIVSLKRRVELQDAAVVELEQAQAALAAASARLAQSEGRRAAARLELARAFPTLPLPAHPPSLPDPPPLDPPAAAWRDITVASSHEIVIARYQAEQAETLARRARLDRRPDPTIGIRAFSDFGGREKGVGVYVSTPIGGARRSAVADSEAARATAARVVLNKVEREVAALGEKNALASDAARLAWRSAAESVAASEAAARRTGRGYDLGELDLSATLFAQRQLYDARRAELSARVEAWRAVTRLRLDAHDLWHDAD